MQSIAFFCVPESGDRLRAHIYQCDNDRSGYKSHNGAVRAESVSGYSIHPYKLCKKNVLLQAQKNTKKSK
jgi:hypothetical protein